MRCANPLMVKFGPESFTEQRWKYAAYLTLPTQPESIARWIFSHCLLEEMMTLGVTMPNDSIDTASPIRLPGRLYDPAQPFVHLNKASTTRHYVSRRRSMAFVPWRH